MSEHASPRVNSARLHDFIGRTVRLTCKLQKFNGDTAIVEASDGGQVEIKLNRDSHMSDQYVEVIGNAIDATTIRMLTCINLGSELDMTLVNDAIELTFDPRFSKMFHW